MQYYQARREQCRELADRLIVEYAGAVPPGQILATVFRASRALSPHLDLSLAARLAICESSARRLLTDRVTGREPGAPPPAMAS